MDRQVFHVVAWRGSLFLPPPRPLDPSRRSEGGHPQTAGQRRGAATVFALQQLQHVVRRVPVESALLAPDRTAEGLGGTLRAGLAVLYLVVVLDERSRGRVDGNVSVTPRAFAPLVVLLWLSDGGLDDPRLGGGRLDGLQRGALLRQRRDELVKPVQPSPGLRDRCAPGAGEVHLCDDRIAVAGVHVRGDGWRLVVVLDGVRIVSSDLDCEKCVICHVMHCRHGAAPRSSWPRGGASCVGRFYDAAASSCKAVRISRRATVGVTPK